MSALPGSLRVFQSPSSRRDPARVALLLCVTCGIVAVLDTALVAARETAAADRTILLDIHHSAPAALGPDMRFVSLAGGPTGMDLIVGLAGLYFLWRRYFAAAILSVMGVLGAQLIETLLKSALARTRPHLWTSAQIVHSYSFPSGHASSAAAAAAGIAFGLYLAHGRATAAVAAAVGSLVALTVGFSRLYLGVHWPTDVLGGFALALGWVSLLVLLVRRSGSSIGDRSMASFGRLR